MRRLPVSLFVAAPLFALTSCLNVVDIAQPSEVRAGSEFEVGLAVRADAYVPNRVPASGFGVLAVSLPEGSAVAEAGFRGAARGKLWWWENVDGGSLGERPGYVWIFFGTGKAYDWPALAGQVFDVKLRIKANTTPGDYRLGYVAGVVPAAPEGGPDLERLEWGRAGAEGFAARWVTFK